jgi:hypothetical protein
MKKTLVALMAAVLLSTTAVYASNPVSNWLNKTADSIESTNKSVKAEEQSWISQWKAKRAEAKAKRDAQEAQVKAKQNALNKEVTETKNAFKRLFTWDWK